jgi:hypothetical protein
MSWLPFYCGAVLVDLDDEPFSLITPGEADSTSSLSEVMKFTYTEDTPALRVHDERCRHLDRELTFKLIYRYCPGMIAWRNVRDMAGYDTDVRAEYG